MPAYNEEKRIGSTLEAYATLFDNLVKQKKLDYQILVVINGTTDKTREVVSKISKKYNKIKWIESVRRGKGFAIMEGFKKSLEENFELIGFVDADMATPPEAYYALVKNINNYDGIIGSRWVNGAKVSKRTFLRAILSKGFNTIVRILFLIKQRDTQCGAKIFKNKVIKKIINELYSTEWAFDVNLLYLCKRYNFKIKEFPTIWTDKEDSKIEIMKTPVQMFSGVLRLRLMYSIFEPLLRPIKFILRIGDRLFNRK